MVLSMVLSNILYFCNLGELKSVKHLQVLVILKNVVNSTSLFNEIVSEIQYIYFGIILISLF